ncbi:uncharacterized protein LOC111263413 isoform X3 [Varroa jacobsoni]|uniref:uncharacterized protein LOC111263413 isoform X3 n=1 Tax=Varroa jacobsoni TaxID=62625 RepID=UPI000BF34A4D|nr:uncharacterized protein LOC111263413 isoform X3 [Varroa jacobsoni]
MQLYCHLEEDCFASLAIDCGVAVKTLGGDQGVQYLVARRKECGTSHVHRRNSGLAREARMCKIAGGEGVSIGRIMAPSPAPRDHEHPGGSILNAAQITPLRRQLSSVGRCSSLDTKFHRSHKHLLGLEVEELRELNRPPGPDRLIFDKDENGLDGGGGINSDELRLDMDRSLAAEASSGAGTHSWMDMNLYSTKNAISQGLLTLALLTSNASQLRSILQNGPRANRFYLICLSAVGTALTLQVTVGILLIIKGRFNINRAVQQRPAELVNNLVLTGVFLVAVANIFLTAFVSSGETIGRPFEVENVTVSTQSRESAEDFR